MIEDEAKTKWCPMVRVAIDGTFLINNRNQVNAEDKGRATCIGSECMAWRWHLQTKPMEYGMLNVSGGPDEYSETEGYCGLAGNP